MRMAAKDRYSRDPIFRSLVDHVRILLEGQADITATEVREAVMLGCEMYEYTHIRPLFICKEDICRG